MTTITEILNGTITQDSSVATDSLKELIENINQTELTEERNSKINNYLKFVMNSYDDDTAISCGKQLINGVTTKFKVDEIECFPEYFKKYKNKVMDVTD